MGKLKAQQKAFAEIIDRNAALIQKVANIYGCHADDREDLIQEIILQLWRSYPQYKAQYALSTWIYRIALNVSISHYRKEKVRRSAFKEGNDQIKTWSQREPAEESVGSQLLYQFIEGLDELNKALMLLYLDQKSHAEIALILGISTSNVSTKINRIKKQLKVYIEKRNKHEN